MGKLSGTVKALVAALVVYVVADFFLTPLGGLETRPVSGVTPTGFVTLGLIFAGLVLAVISVVLLFRGSRHSGITAAIAAVLYLPAPFIDATGIFSKFRPPLVISVLEWIQEFVAVVTIVLAMRVFAERRGSGPAA